MATLTKIVLSGSTNGRAIKVAATATPGTLLHTAGAVSGASNHDEVYLWAQNTDPASLKLTLEWGGVTVPDDLIEVTLAGEAGPKLVVPGWPLENSLILRAFAASANLITIFGYVIRSRT